MAKKMIIKIIRKSKDGESWYNEYVGCKFTSKKYAGFEIYMGAVYVTTPSRRLGYIPKGDYEIIKRDKTINYKKI